VKSLKHKHQVKAEQLQAVLSTADLILVFQSSHLTAGAFAQLRKEATLAFAGQSVAPIYFTGRSSVYKRLVSEDRYQAFLRLFSGPSCLLCVNWEKSDLASARRGVGALRRWFAACGIREEGTASSVKAGPSNNGSIGSLAVMGGIFEGRLLSAEEVGAAFVSESSEWAQTWRLPECQKEQEFLEGDFITGGRSLLPALETLYASYFLAGADCLHSLGCLSALAKESSNS
jgi:hypothetical protein